MKTFKQFLIEHYINVLTPEEKKPYLNDVWDILQKAYERNGGIKGKGFSSKDELLNFPNSMWKLNRQDGKIVNVTVYHGKRGGRKLVAAGVVKEPDTGKTSKLGKEIFNKSRLEDLKTGRCWFEVSHSALQSIKELLGDEFDKYVIPLKTVISLFPNDEIRPTHGNYYEREIGGEFIEKIALGNPKAEKIYIKE